MSMNGNTGTMNELLPDVQFLQNALKHIGHVLPGQGPILDFVHHNTIHGFQHLPFFEALAEYEKLTGIRGFQSPQTSREFYRKGRISDEDIAWAITEAGLSDPDLTVHEGRNRRISGSDIYRVCLLHEIDGLHGRQLDWQLLEGAALSAAGADHHEFRQLWAVLNRLVPPGNQASAGNPETTPKPEIAASDARLLFGNPDAIFTMREIFMRLSGRDILEKIRPLLIRVFSGVLDEGLAMWHIADERQPCLYKAWCHAMRLDLTAFLDDVPNADAVLDSLPECPFESIARQLEYFGIAREHWSGYLKHLALELPGWAGLINWRQQNPGYETVNPARPALEDFLAIRLILDRLYLGNISSILFHCEPSMDSLQLYFHSNPDELIVRTRLYSGLLPEMITRKVKALIIQLDAEAPGHKGWQGLADEVLSWEQDTAPVNRKQDRLWRLFLLSRHLGLDAAAITDIGIKGLACMENLAERFTLHEQGKVWLLAFEKHYHDNIFNALRCNRNRSGLLQRRNRPCAQIVMCMDEREESFRRHLEEVNPDIETLGAAGFFGIPMRYKGLDSHHSTPLCPVVVTPVNKVHEAAEPDHGELIGVHVKGRQSLDRLLYIMHQRFRLEPVTSMLASLLLLPVLLADLLLSTLLHGRWITLIDRMRKKIMPPVKTRLQFTSASEDQSGLRHGFTDREQADRVSGMLRTLGLTENFAPIVALAGHGSTSQNNPHEAAHDCGACGGRQGGPNARVFAAMANRKEVRRLLSEQGINIPDDTWFAGMQHDTCSDLITWYDTDLVPDALIMRFAAFRSSVEQAQHRSAHERCRRFMSAREAVTPAMAFDHVVRRSRDLTQVRPEYGHATNAAAVIGRRQLTRGVFFDRRLFLISYDPDSDPEGHILENILLTAGPVGAGINLEYYFSTIDNDRFGCGTKIPHNVTGLCAVMEGAGSDLRTGLPLQMVEIHEAMRLQVIVEATTEVLTRIYTDNPPLQELIGGGWLLVSAIDPQSGETSVFNPAKGFLPWRGEKDLPELDTSIACYRGLDTPIDPVLIKSPGERKEAA